MNAARHAGLDLGLLLIRLIVAVVFVFHGSQKLFKAFEGPGLEAFAEALAKMDVPNPELSAKLAACTEFFGGILLGAGFLTRLVAIPMAFTMGVAVVKAHPNAFSIQQHGMEYALTLGVVLVALVFTGPGRLSLDQLLFGSRKAPPPAPPA